MSDNEGSVSMFQTVQNHEERITKLEENDRELKENFSKLSEQMVKLESQNSKLENTLLNDNRETRSTMKEQTEKMFRLVENAMGYQSNRTAQQHEFKMLKWKTIADVFFKICGAVSVLGASGGLIYMIFEHFFTK